jgi:hypothetical protein
MGKTIAELGNRNRPIDVIVYQKDGKDFLLLANSARGVMKISTENVAKAERIESRVADKRHGHLSVEEVSDWKGIEQLDKLDTKQALVLRKAEGGAMTLESLALP